MPINMLEWFTPAPNTYLNGTHEMCTRMYVTRIVQIKSVKQGFPTDTWAISNGMISFFQTENATSGDGWHNPKDFKINVNNLPVLCPVNLPDPLPWTSVVSKGNVHQSYVNAVWDGKNNMLDVYTVVNQPVSIDHGGDVGRQDTILLDYFWGKASRETYSLAKGFGLVGWQAASLVNGVYVTSTDSKTGKLNVAVFNKIVKVNPMPEPVFGFPASWLP